MLKPFARPMLSLVACAALLLACDPEGAPPPEEAPLQTETLAHPVAATPEGAIPGVVSSLPAVVPAALAPVDVRRDDPNAQVVTEAPVEEEQALPSGRDEEARGAQSPIRAELAEPYLLLDRGPGLPLRARIEANAFRESAVDEVVVDRNGRTLEGGQQ